jgi:hypothetical protein
LEPFFGLKKRRETKIVLSELTSSPSAAAKFPPEAKAAAELALAMKPAKPGPVK